MKLKLRILLQIIACFLFAFNFSFKSPDDTTQYKCMVQLINYQGEGAYITVSIVDNNGKYHKTLKVLGEDKEWYPDLTSWWSFFENKAENHIDGITGATIAGGERSVFVLNIDNKYLTNEYKLRFETAVEDQKYYEKDLEVSLGGGKIDPKLEGVGYIRYVRLLNSGS